MQNEPKALISPSQNARGTAVKERSSRSSVASNEQIIGWREWIGLPELGVNQIKAKVDTGARSSALHVVDLEEFQRANDKFVRFKVYPKQRNKERAVIAEARVLEYRNVRSSSGKSQLRPVVLTVVKLLGQTWSIELTLTNRDQMGFRMLLGREAFRQRFLVDAGKSFFGGRPKRKKPKKNE